MPKIKLLLDGRAHSVVTESDVVHSSTHFTANGQTMAPGEIRVFNGDVGTGHSKLPATVIQSRLYCNVIISISHK